MKRPIVVVHTIQFGDPSAPAVLHCRLGRHALEISAAPEKGEAYEAQSLRIMREIHDLLARCGVRHNAYERALLYDPARKHVDAVVISRRRRTRMVVLYPFLPKAIVEKL